MVMLHNFSADPAFLESAASATGADKNQVQALISNMRTQMAPTDPTRERGPNQRDAGPPPQQPTADALRAQQAQQEAAAHSATGLAAPTAENSGATAGPVSILPPASTDIRYSNNT